LKESLLSSLKKKANSSQIPLIVAFQSLAVGEAATLYGRTVALVLGSSRSWGLDEFVSGK